MLLVIGPWLAVFLAGRWSVGSGSIAKPWRYYLYGPGSGVDKTLLTEPPSGHSEVQVPSVLQDARGSIHNLRIGGFRFNVLVSKAGALRSGDVHTTRQHDFIFSGEAQLTTLEYGADVNRRYGAGDHIVIPENTPHLFAFMNDTVMAEWWEGDFDCKYYTPYRDLVAKHMQSVARKQAGLPPRHPPESLGVSSRSRIGHRHTQRGS